MVDFQSRDTRRGIEDDANSDEQATNSAEEGDSLSRTVEDETASEPDAIAYAVVTVTDERTVETDSTGEAVVAAIEAAGDVVVTRELLSPSYDGVQHSLDTLVDREDVDAVVTVGGTGVEPDDVTVDAATDLFDTPLPGFGELFRLLSHDHDGSAIVRTRATAGLVDAVPVCCLPGEPTAARRGVEQIVVDEVPEIVALATGDVADSSTASD